MGDEGRPTAKVLFRVEYEDGSAKVETLWAYDLGDDKYRLANSPFYAYSVSWEDVVLAPLDEIEGRATFVRVLEKSGNRTVRIIFPLRVETGNESDRILAGLVAIGCSYEGAHGTHMSITVPVEVELDSVRQYLIRSGANWEHADPTYEELFPVTD